MANERLLRLKTGAIDETKKLFGIFIYLWVLLSLFSFHKELVLNEENLIYHQGFALINALALAKVVLVGEIFHVGDNLKNKPLIYPIVFKSEVFAVILICFHFVEEMLIGVLHGKTFSQSIPNIGGGKLQGILMVGIIMFVVLLPFFAFRELDRAIGTEELHALLFGAKPVRQIKPPDKRHTKPDHTEGHEVSYKKGYDQDFQIGLDPKSSRNCQHNRNRDRSRHWSIGRIELKLQIL